MRNFLIVLFHISEIFLAYETKAKMLYMENDSFCLQISLANNLLAHENF